MVIIIFLLLQHIIYYYQKYYYIFIITNFIINNNYIITNPKVLREGFEPRSFNIHTQVITRFLSVCKFSITYGFRPVDNKSVCKIHM